MGGKRRGLAWMGLVLGAAGVALGADNVRLEAGARTGSVRLEGGASEVRVRSGVGSSRVGRVVGPVWNDPVVTSRLTLNSEGIGWMFVDGRYHFVESRFGAGLQWAPKRGRYPLTWDRYRLGWRGWDTWWRSSFQGPPLVEITRRVDPALLGLSTEPTAPAAPVDEGLAAIGSGAWARAGAIYLERAETRRRLELEDVLLTPDRRDLRLAAFALAGDGQLERASLLMAQAYGEDPTLRDRELDGGVLGVRAGEMRRMVTRAVAHAHSTESAEAWLLVSVLMHAEGRHDLARRMLDRAGRADAEGVRETGSEGEEDGAEEAGEGETSPAETWDLEGS